MTIGKNLFLSVFRKINPYMGGLFCAFLVYRNLDESGSALPLHGVLHADSGYGTTLSDPGAGNSTGRVETENYGVIHPGGKTVAGAR